MITKTLTKVLNYADRYTIAEFLLVRIVCEWYFFFYTEGMKGRRSAFPELFRRMVDFIFWESGSSLLLTNLGNPLEIYERVGNSAGECCIPRPREKLFQFFK